MEKGKIVRFIATAAMATTMLFGTVPQAKEVQSAITQTQGRVELNKPVIYLYGYEGQKDVTVKISLAGGDTKMTYPKIGTENTWKFDVDKNGDLLFGDAKYRYLFWDGYLDKADFTFNKGACIAGNQTQDYLEKKLNEFHFNDQERQDFITYWVPQMKSNKYNVISFQTTPYTSKAKLTITPKPTSLIRVYMAWYPSETMINIPEQSFKVPARTSRTVVEWGGTKVAEEGTDELINNVTQGVTDSFGSVSQLEEGTETQTSSGTNTQTAGTQTTQALQTTTPPVVTVPVDPYAQYGVMAACAKDWDSCGISNTNGKWANIDESLRAQAYNHWLEYKTAGW